MATRIIQEKRARGEALVLQRGGYPVAAEVGRGEALARVCALLPSAVALEAARRAASLLADGERVEEIRLRADKQVYLTLGGRGGRRSLALESAITADELEATLRRMCDGSLYSYADSINRGYVSLGEGVRVGVCGRASTEGGRVIGVYSVSSLNIRLPCAAGEPPPQILSAARTSIRSGLGVLIYSPPAEGKTTLLRSLASALSEGEPPLRVSLVDSRDELSLRSRHSRATLDLLVGYPKAEAISIATAFMSPEVIICDEIGAEDDVRAICEAQNCGVPLIASAHAASVEGLLRRPSMLTLHESGVFGLYIGLRISGGAPGYTLVTREEAERRLEDNGNASARAVRSVSLLAKA